MKKGNFIDTIIKVGVAAAAIGGTLYLFKDKIEENPKCKEAVDKVKDTIKKYVPETPDTFEEEDFFDEDFDEIIHTSSTSERGYVNIKLPSDEELEDAAMEAVTED